MDESDRRRNSVRFADDTPPDREITSNFNKHANLSNREGENLDSLSDMRMRMQFSDRSKRCLEDSESLLKSIRNRRPLIDSSSLSAIPTSLNRLGDQSLQDHAERILVRSRRSVSPDDCAENASTSRYLLHTPKFPRIDFDDRIDELSEKPAWKVLEEKVKGSYNKPKSTVERNKNLNEFRSQALNDMEISRQRQRRTTELPFKELSSIDSESFLPRAPSWLNNDVIAPRGMKLATSVESAPYCAPHVHKSQGIEKSEPMLNRYSRMADDVTARLLKTSILPDNMKTLTKREHHDVPVSLTASPEQFDDEDVPYMPRPYYSRPNRLDKDYFDFDLQHSVDMFRRPEGKFIPTPPQPWETKLLNDFKTKGDGPLSTHLFGPKGPSDFRATQTSYLSAALRTPSFWEHRFTTIGNQVRQSEPISLASLELLRPKPNKFNTYIDPDFENYEDPKESDE